MDDARLFRSLYDDLWDAGRDLGLAAFRRPRASRCGWRRATARSTRIFAPTIRLPKPGSIASSISTSRFRRPRRAALAERASGPKRKFVVMEVADADAEQVDIFGYESIMKGRRGRGLRHVAALTAIASTRASRRATCRRRWPTMQARAFEIDILGQPLLCPRRDRSARAAVRSNAREGDIARATRYGPLRTPRPLADEKGRPVKGARGMRGGLFMAVLSFAGACLRGRRTPGPRLQPRHHPRAPDCVRESAHATARGPASAGQARSSDPAWAKTRRM
jgi:hypothetical protein